MSPIDNFSATFAVSFLPFAQERAVGRSQIGDDKAVFIRVVDYLAVPPADTRRVFIEYDVTGCRVSADDHLAL